MRCNSNLAHTWDTKKPVSQERLLYVPASCGPPWPLCSNQQQQVSVEQQDLILCTHGFSKPAYRTTFRFANSAIYAENRKFYEALEV